jgi:ADP-heptose:LPS heptosyltransferase
VVALAGPAELEDGRRAEIEGAFRGVADAFFQEPDLVTLAGILAASAAYVGNDSGVTHLAAAVGARVVAVFGPTDPAVWRPRCRVTSEGPEPTPPKQPRLRRPDAARPRGGGVRVARHSSGKVDDVTADEVMDALRGLLG